MIPKQKIEQICTEAGLCVLDQIVEPDSLKYSKTIINSSDLNSTLFNLRYILVPKVEVQVLDFGGLDKLMSLALNLKRKIKINNGEITLYYKKEEEQDRIKRKGISYQDFDGALHYDFPRIHIKESLGKYFVREITDFEIDEEAKLILETELKMAKIPFRKRYSFHEEKEEKYIGPFVESTFFIYPSREVCLRLKAEPGETHCRHGYTPLNHPVISHGFLENGYCSSICLPIDEKLFPNWKQTATQCGFEHIENFRD